MSGPPHQPTHSFLNLFIISCFEKTEMGVKTYASAVQLPCCCRLDHRILLMALGIIQAKAIQAPKKLKSRSVTVATATPAETTTSARTYIFFFFLLNIYYERLEISKNKSENFPLDGGLVC